MFGNAKVRVFEVRTFWVHSLFRDFFGQKYLTETREILPFIFLLEVYLVKIVFELATKKIIYLNYLKCLKIMNFSYCIEVRSSDSEVRVRPAFFMISSRCSKFGKAKVRVFEVRTFWVHSNTSLCHAYAYF